MTCDLANANEITFNVKKTEIVLFKSYIKNLLDEVPFSRKLTRYGINAKEINALSFWMKLTRLQQADVWRLMRIWSISGFCGVFWVFSVKRLLFENYWTITHIKLMSYDICLY